MPQSYYSADACRLEDFKEITSQSLDTSLTPYAASVVDNIPVYDIAALADVLASPDSRQNLLAEFGWVLLQGPGVLVLRGAFPDTSVLDEASAIYDQIIADEKATKVSAADHFAKAGANDRIWNSLQKLCLADPTVFARYFGNTAIDAVCEAWLGPCYQMTAQINLVRPGGKAQEPHRDYHLGFQTADEAGRFPPHVHDLSPLLTLQGAVAHCDMPIESGPTKLLPYSQLYRPGYMAYRRQDFRDYFEANYVQASLSKGDALFFNPALFHAAGDNISADIQRMANLLQVSSAMGRALENIDRIAMCKRLYPVLQSLLSDGSLSPEKADAAIAACAEGYSFPTNLDSDPPIGGLVPETQAALFHRALRDGMTPENFAAALDAQDARRRA
ncbi:MAG TPA: phytanoyl-CoA dioxygenase family protein [Paracoccaceae bacterium]|nr:phytanoyl-CoA dioxygenase family protein [Paracoccaceae bacterium]